MADDILHHNENGVELFTVKATGESGMSQRGLARACGVDPKSIRKIEDALRTKEPSKWLKPLQGCHWDLGTHGINVTKNGRAVRIYNARFCTAVIQHFAFSGRDAAQETLASIGEIGLTSFIQGKTGWLPEEYQTSKQARESINRIIDKRRPPHPLFGDENMNRIAKFLKVGREHPKLALWMWRYIYCTFSAEEKAKLDLVNPVQPNGHRRNTIHQWIEQNATLAHKKHFDKVLTLVQIAQSEQDFTNLFARLDGVFQQSLFDDSSKHRL